MGNGSHQNKDKKANRRITQHKRFISFGTYPNSAFGGTSFMLEPLYEMPEPLKNEGKAKNECERCLMFG